MPNITEAGLLDIKVGSDAIDATPYVKSFLWVESMIRGGWSWALRFDTDAWVDWQEILLGLGREKYIRLRTESGDKETSTDWALAVVDGSTMSIRGRTLISMVKGGDRRLQMMQTARTRAWPESTVASVIRATALEYSLASDVEETAGQRDRWQIRESDWAHLRRLASNAGTGAGRGDSYLWLDRDTLRFGAPNFAARSDRRHDLNAMENRVDRTVLQYHGRAVDRAGGATLRAVGHDHYAGEPLVFDVNAGAVETQPTLGSRVPRAQSDGLKVYAVVEDQQDLVEETARGIWGEAAPRYFSMRVDGRSDLALRPGTMIELEATLGPDQQLPVFGRYAVLEVQHELIGGQIRTTASCYRREAYEGEEDPSGASASGVGSRDMYSLATADIPPRTVLVAEMLE